ncbi:P-loop containing nucleoside triphosphate hydrolase protein [Aspergillus eucalypticola CBS 122712]|uniref:P-loop containing nucleoside triphosphate hydrolase protein n=1 Tax=Aspergillus eucalypticola (strain CBS 122712 / IBT 29274) TaxID=1448314 RepID=A0A317UL56_ASPEC|nr:P-loop containing nucleoside triphosphate hydrolase protein [Aspergillus eucalypticola CBS 122712]PWY61417.1 P-loop containing nucleoside triphosphate hydrolase protein [Aspergillus eucalypticola CBS 122712]
MGASGAGKTTLLDTLAQRKRTGKIEGTFRLNSELLDESFERSCGFVMQQDIHEPFATMAYVEHIIHLLDLENIAEALVGQPGDGQLSVEERKRVTIGVELAARPSSLLFLDEPTSGLDSQASFELVLFLRRIAAEGIPVVCTIHQPSGVLFDMFDQVLLLAPGGRTVYFGETALEANITQLNSSIASKETKINSSQLYASSSQNKYALSLWAQTIAVTKRHWISVWRDGMYNFSKIAKSFFVSMFIASVSSTPDTPSKVYKDLWFRKWAIFTAREQNGIYDWRALLTAHLLDRWLSKRNPVAGLYYFMWILLGIFGTGYSHLLAALFPSANLGGYANSLFWVILMIVSGVLTPHAYLNDFYRPGCFGSIPCATSSALRSVRSFTVLRLSVPRMISSCLIAPPGSTCGQYTAAFLGSNPGYIVNPERDGRLLILSVFGR